MALFRMASIVILRLRGLGFGWSINIVLLSDFIGLPFLTHLKGQAVNFVSLMADPDFR